MAKLPRYNASVSPSRSPGMVRATDFSTLTNTGEQAALAKASQAVQIKAGGQQAIAGGMANIGGMLREMGQAAYQLEMKRRDAETRQLNTNNEVAFSDHLENLRIQAEESRPRFGEERTELTKAALKESAKFREQQRKDLELTGNKPAMKLFDLQTPGNELLAKTILRREYTRQLDRELTVNGLGSMQAFVDMGKYGEARETMASLVENKLIGEEVAKAELDKMIVRKVALDTLNSVDLEAAIKLVRSMEDIDPDDKESIVLDLKKENLKNVESLQSFENQIWQMMLNGDSNRVISDFLESLGPLADPEWKLAQIAKMDRGRKLIFDENKDPYRVTVDSEAMWGMYEKCMKDPLSVDPQDLYDGVADKWSVADFQMMRNIVMDAREGKGIKWHDTQIMYIDRIKEMYNDGSLTLDERDRINREMRDYFFDETNASKTHLEVRAHFDKVCEPAVEKAVRRWIDNPLLTRPFGPSTIQKAKPTNKKINVIGPNGESGTIDESELKEAEENGWKLSQ